MKSIKYVNQQAILIIEIIGKECFFSPAFHVMSWLVFWKHKQFKRISPSGVKVQETERPFQPAPAEILSTLCKFIIYLCFSCGWFTLFNLPGNATTGGGEERNIWQNNLLMWVWFEMMLTPSWKIRYIFNGNLSLVFPSLVSRPALMTLMTINNSGDLKY